MFNQKVARKAGRLISGSSLGLVLFGSLHAAEVPQLAAADTRHVIDRFKNSRPSLQYHLDAEAALQKGQRLRKQATTPWQHRLAFEFINYAAKQGLAEAQFQCAIMYLDDQYVPADDFRAIQLLEKAIAQGHKQAEIALNFIRYGDDGFGC